MSILSIRDLSIQNKKVLLRVDFNVPLKDDGTIRDPMRINETLPTIQFLMKGGAKIILLSHLGKPKGIKNLKYSLKPCAEFLSNALGKKIFFIPDCLGKETKAFVDQMKPGDIALLENLRFYEAEEKPNADLSFAKTLSSYGEMYVNDAFAASHRDHSSITFLARYFPDCAASGFLLEKEISALSTLCISPSKPFHVILGGAKVSSKLGVIKAFIQKAQALYIGGAMSFTFFKALGHSIGDSLFEPDLVPIAQDLISLCKEKKISLFFPEDIIVAKFFADNAPKKTVNILEEGIEMGWQGMDIGPKTIISWKKSLQNAACIFWNGPLGVFELPQFSEGTFSLIHFLASLSSQRIVGGGDTASAVHQLNLSKNFTFISTGGGASLEFIESGHLPGIDALTKNKNF